VLELIERTRISRDEVEAELTGLIDQAVGMGIGWPEIAARLGVTRQAARQHHQRRHRAGTSRQAPAS
jgi:predicted transcriptional regulator